LRNESVLETKVKLFLILKRKHFNLQIKVKVFPKRKRNFFGTKMFLFRKHLPNKSVFGTKVKLFLFLKRFSVVFLSKKC